MEFRQPTETETILKRLPSAAMEFNGKYIENELNGYETLKVSGRETISNELVVESVHEGGITSESRLPSRSIQITYEMKAETSELFQEQYKALRKILTTDEEVPIKFADEPTTVYFGRLSTFGDVPDDKNHIVGTLIIHCDSPYKFSDLVTTSGDVTIDTFYQPRPEQIILDVPQTVNRIEINHNDYRIVANGTFNAGSKAVFDFEPKDMTLTVNDVEATYMVALNSDFENFRLSDGTVTSPQGNITLIAREWWL